MSRFLFIVSAFVFTAMASVGSANVPRPMPVALDAMQAVAMETDDVALAPLSFVRFCMDHGRECEGSGQPGALIALSQDTLALIDLVNRDVNRQIRPVAKSDVGGFGRWTLNPSAGDCNDYAVSKRHELIKRGLPVSALLLAVARTAWGEGHLLLIVRTDRGDLVLDNLAAMIRPWDKTDYAWIKRQSPVDPMRWETVAADGRAARITAALQRSRVLAEARAEKRREARLLLAEARHSAEARTSFQARNGQDPSVAVPRVSLEYELLPLWARSVRSAVVADVDGAMVAHPRFEAAEIEPAPRSDRLAPSAHSLPTALLTGVDWSANQQSFAVALVADAETVFRHSIR